MEEFSWPADEDKLLVLISTDENATVDLDTMTQVAFLDFRRLQPPPADLTRGRKTKTADEDIDDWIPVDLAWLAAGVALAALTSITAVMCVAIKKNYNILIDFGEKSGNAKIRLNR